MNNTFSKKFNVSHFPGAGRNNLKKQTSSNRPIYQVDSRRQCSLGGGNFTRPRPQDHDVASQQSAYLSNQMGLLAKPPTNYNKKSLDFAKQSIKGYDKKHRQPGKQKLVLPTITSGRKFPAFEQFSWQQVDEGSPSFSYDQQPQ